MEISAEAMRAAVAISDVVSDLLAECGMVRAAGAARSTEVIAKMVQCAIDERLDRAGIVMVVPNERVH